MAPACQFPNEPCVKGIGPPCYPCAQAWYELAVVERSYVFHQDPGHGWLAVPLADLTALGISRRISGYSYLRDSIAYLEEDCDMPTFLHFANAAGWSVTVVLATREATHIRSFSHYLEAPEYDYTANMLAIYGAPASSEVPA